MQNLPKLTLLTLLVAGSFWLAQHPAGFLRGADDSTPAKAATPATSVGNSESNPSTVAEEAVALLHEARQRLFGYSSVRASIRQYVQLGEQRFEANGLYVAGPLNPLPQLRLEYQVRVGNSVGTLLEVCDGQILRSQRTLKRLDKPMERAVVTPDGTVGNPNGQKDPNAPETTVTRRDVRKILDAVRKHGQTPETILQAELGIGGLPALLTSIESAMVFTSVREEPLAGRRCLVLQGTWKPEFLQQITQQFQYFGRNVKSWIPEFARIHLDAETLFPMRITYWPAPAESGPALPALLTLEFTDVRINEPISPLLFEFPNNGVDETDLTGQFIEAIQKAAQAPTGAATPPQP